MQSDTKGIVWVIGLGAAVTALGVVIVALAAVGVLPLGVAATLASIVAAGGVVVIGIAVVQGIRM
jgi:hypothetical protein